jgi:hypothetical protein
MALFIFKPILVGEAECVRRGTQRKLMASCFMLESVNTNAMLHSRLRIRLYGMKNIEFY